MPSAEFEPAITAKYQRQAYALDGTATKHSIIYIIRNKNHMHFTSFLTGEESSKFRKFIQI